MRLTTLAVLVAVAVTGCVSQKKEAVSFDEALKKDLLTFEYRLVECAPGSRNSDYYIDLNPVDKPTDLTFTSEESAKIGLDRGNRGSGTIVRLTAKRGDNTWVTVEAEMDDSRVFSGTTFTRGREGFQYRTVDLVRHVAPRMTELLRKKPGEESK